jgi:hypothetical protein
VNGCCRQKLHQADQHGRFPHPRQTPHSIHSP